MKKKTNADLTTRPELAAYLGVHPGTVTKWEKDGMPVAQKAGRGRPTRFDATACAAWRLAKDAAGATQHLSLEQARARHAIASALESEQRVALRAKTLILAADAEQVWADEISRCRTKLLVLSRKAKAILPHLSVKDVQALDRLIREALEDLAAGAEQA